LCILKISRYRTPFQSQKLTGSCSVSVIQAPQFHASTIVLLMVATVACFYRCRRPRRCYGVSEIINYSVAHLFLKS